MKKRRLINNGTLYNRKCYLPRKVVPVIEMIGNKKIEVDKYTERTEEIGR